MYADQGKINHLCANVRLIHQAAILPKCPGLLPRTFWSKPARGHLFRRTVQAEFSWRRGGDGGLEGGVFRDREQFWRDHVAGEEAKALLGELAW